MKGRRLQTYARGGKISGVLFQNRKFRFKRLGWTEERVAELDVGMKRVKEITKMREKRKYVEKRIEK